VEVQAGSRLETCLGLNYTQVNSIHHQGLNHLAPALIPSAYAPDGLVEAVELRDYPYGLGVQWHPEWLTAHTPMRSLFASFIQACRQRRNQAPHTGAAPNA
jgi:gamma-glutamyl-gamma-aminobutyrate hydrolase PuuD